MPPLNDGLARLNPKSHIICIYIYIHIYAYNCLFIHFLHRYRLLTNILCKKQPAAQIAKHDLCRFSRDMLLPWRVVLQDFSHPIRVALWRSSLVMSRKTANHGSLPSSVHGIPGRGFVTIVSQWLFFWAVGVTTISWDNTVTSPTEILKITFLYTRTGKMSGLSGK